MEAIVKKAKKRRELTLMVTGACNMNCQYCSVAAWREDFRDYHMSMDEVELACRRARELMPNSVRRLYLTGGEPSVWTNLEDGLQHAKSSGAFHSVWVSSNCIESERLSAAIDKKLIDRVCTQVSNASAAGLRALLKRYGPVKIHVSRVRRVHKPVPEIPLEGVLPADCGCDRPVVFNYRVYPCAPVYAHMKRLGWDMDEPKIWATLDEDWYSKFKTMDRYNMRACQVCVANRKAWKKIPNP